MESERNCTSNVKSNSIPPTLKTIDNTKNNYIHDSEIYEKKVFKNIGPSQFGTILGMNKWETKENLKWMIENGLKMKTNYAKSNGIKFEPVAKQKYEMENKSSVSPGRWVRLHPRVIGICDGLVGKDGGVEIKCPVYKENMNVGMISNIPPHYLVQMVAYMAMYKRKWWDYYVCVFHPESGDLKLSYMERIHWKDYEKTWENEWWPRIVHFVDSVKFLEM